MCALHFIAIHPKVVESLHPKLYNINLLVVLKEKSRITKIIWEP